MRNLLLCVFLLVGCSAPYPSADMATAPSDMSSAMLDMGVDASPASDFAECIQCNPLINPCPAIGLYCWPIVGCCDVNRH